MNIFHLNMRVFYAFIFDFTFYFAFKWFVFPKLAKHSINDTLVPMALIHGLRYLGMAFMVDTQVYNAFPDNLAYTVGIWDYSTAILAIVTAFFLKNK